MEGLGREIFCVFVVVVDELDRLLEAGGLRCRVAVRKKERIPCVSLRNKGSGGDKKGILEGLCEKARKVRLPM